DRAVMRLDRDNATADDPEPAEALPEHERRLGRAAGSLDAGPAARRERIPPGQPDLVDEPIVGAKARRHDGLGDIRKPTADLVTVEELDVAQAEVALARDELALTVGARLVAGTEEIARLAHPDVVAG